MRNISGTKKFYEQKKSGSTISISLYFYFSFIEKIILSSENRSLDDTFARSPERGEFFDPCFRLDTLCGTILYNMGMENNCVYPNAGILNKSK